MKSTNRIASRALASALALAGALACGSTSQAEVRYTFEFASIYSVGPPISFEYTSPDFIDTHRTVAVADLDACVTYAGTMCGPPEFFPDIATLISSGEDIYDAVFFNFTQGDGGSGSYHYFEDGALGHDGVYMAVSDIDGPARLTVTTTVPEPATWAMLLLGFSGLGAALRRRRDAPSH